MLCDNPEHSEKDLERVFPKLFRAGTDVFCYVIRESMHIHFSTHKSEGLICIMQNALSLTYLVNISCE